MPARAQPAETLCSAQKPWGSKQIGQHTAQIKDQPTTARHMPQRVLGQKRPRWTRQSRRGR